MTGIISSERADEEDRLLVPLDTLGVESKYRQWITLLKEDPLLAVDVLFDGENYDALGILISGVLGETFGLEHRLLKGVDFGLLWCSKTHSMAFIPPREVLAFMCLDRIVDSLELNTAQALTDQPLHHAFELTRYGLLQRLNDERVCARNIAYFMEEVGWGTLLDLLNFSLDTADPFGPMAKVFNIVTQ